MVKNTAKDEKVMRVRAINKKGEECLKKVKKLRKLTEIGIYQSFQKDLREAEIRSKQSTPMKRVFSLGQLSAWSVEKFEDNISEKL